MMEYQVVENLNQRYLECQPGGPCLQNEDDALDCVAACGEHGTNLLMIHAANLPPDFYDLKTGLAGKILLKFSMYALKVAAVIPSELSSQGRFGEMVLETNRFNREFRVFPTRADAEAWLIRAN